MELSSSPILPSTYNSLPSIDNTTVVANESLQALGRIFALHKVESKVGVGLLHKHFELAPETVMVHHKHICKPEYLPEETNLQGASFFWDGTKLQAFEYDNADPLCLPIGFLEDFVQYIQTNQLPSR